jgi:hypothetical protein
VKWGLTDGIVEVWMNGVKKVSATGIKTWYTTGHSPLEKARSAGGTPNSSSAQAEDGPGNYSTWTLHLPRTTSAKDAGEIVEV